MPTSGLTAIPAGANLLLDANVLVYALAGLSAQCVELLRRCDIEDVYGFTTVEIVNEVTHRLMVAEALAKGVIQRPAAGALKGRKAAIRSLGDYWAQAQRLLDSNLLILDLDEPRVRIAQRVQSQHGLLTTDSTFAAAALELGIDRLASNDADFLDTPGLTVHRPTDLP
jgi:predicted nucleic acid-binding protein